MKAAVHALLMRDCQARLGLHKRSAVREHRRRAAV